jgi:long-chain fatty acid transport protein
VAVNKRPLDPREEADGRLKYDATNVGYGFNLGTLFTLSPQTRVGVTYVSQVNLDFKDEMRFKNMEGSVLGRLLGATGLLDAQLKINVNLSAQLAVGAYHALTESLALVGTVNWQNWSRFGQPEISVADSNTVTDDADERQKSETHASILLEAILDGDALLELLDRTRPFGLFPARL